MWDRITLYDSETNSVMEFGLVVLDDSPAPELSKELDKKSEESAQEPDQAGDPEQQGDQDETVKTIDEIVQALDEETAKLIHLRIAGLLEDGAPVLSFQEMELRIREQPDWVKVELAQKIGCRFNDVPLVVADFYKKHQEELAGKEKTEEN